MLTIILVAVSVCVTFVYIQQLAKSVYLGWISYLAVIFCNTSFGLDQTQLGPLHIDPYDIVAICILVAGVIRTVPRLKENNSARVLGFCYLTMILLSYIPGIFTYGFPGASNEMRGFSSALTSILYFLTAPTDNESLKKMFRAYYIYAFALIGIAILAHLGFDVGMAAFSHHQINADETRELPVNAAGALAMCFFFSLGRATYRVRSLAAQIMPVIFLVSAVYLRHRTVWTVLLVSFATLAFVDLKLFKRLIPAIVLGGLIAGALVLVDQANSATRDATAEFQESASDTGTLEWRVRGWLAILGDEDQTFISVLAGHNFGAGAWRFDSVTGQYVNAPPHDEYVSQFMRVGIVGLLILLAYIIRPLSRLIKIRRYDNLIMEPSAGVWFVVLVAAMVYGFTYNIEPEYFALVGVLNSLVIKIENEAHEEVDAEVGQFDLSVAL